MEKHLGDCQPCIAFLNSLKLAVKECRIYEPACDTARARELRQELVEKYHAAVAELSHRSS